MSIVIQDGCVSCAMCLDPCPEQCIHEEEEQFAIDHKKCTDCGDCIPVCPVDCIIVI